MEETVGHVIQPAQENSKGTVVFSSDHGGFEYKKLLLEMAREWGYTVMDCGTYSTTSVDYADYIKPAVKEILAGAKGVMICGSGIGMSIGANRFKFIRAALCCDSLMAKLAREHNDANVLILGERLIGKDTAIACLKSFLNTPFLGGRHSRRIEKLDTLT